MLMITVIAATTYLLVPASSEIALLTSKMAGLVDIINFLDIRFREVKFLIKVTCLISGG